MVSAPDLIVLRYLEANGPIALERTGCFRVAMPALARAGLVEFTRPDPQRGRWVGLTAAGRNTLADNPPPSET